MSKWNKTTTKEGATAQTGVCDGMALTEKQEAFTLNYFETGNAAEAYRTAYNKPAEARDHWIYVEASQLLDHPEVSLRLKALREQAQSAAIFNVSKALEEYEEARVLAHSEGMPAAAVGAITGKVKLLGMEAPKRLVHQGDAENPMTYKVQIGG